jgi:hypothetical protein
MSCLRQMPGVFMSHIFYIEPLDQFRDHNYAFKLYTGVRIFIFKEKATKLNT